MATFDKDALTFDQLNEIFHYEPDTGRILWKLKSASKVLVGHEAGCTKATNAQGNKYRYVRVLGKSMAAQRVAWLLHYGEWPTGKIFFEDGNTLNIRIKNLRQSNSVVTAHDLNTAGGRADYQREYRANEGMDWKDGHLRSKFNLTLAEYTAMAIAQGGVCATCKKPETQTRNGNLKALSVDHDHVTGKVRGLLCGHCNTALGKVGDDIKILEAMIAYLKKHAAHVVAPIETETDAPAALPASEELH